MVTTHTSQRPPLIIIVSSGSVYFYNLKNCKKSEYAICAHKDIPVSTMALQKVSITCNCDL